MVALKTSLSPPTNDSYSFIVMITIAEEAEMVSSKDHGCHWSESRISISTEFMEKLEF